MQPLARQLLVCRLSPYERDPQRAARGQHAVRVRRVHGDAGTVNHLGPGRGHHRTAQSSSVSNPKEQVWLPRAHARKLEPGDQLALVANEHAAA